MINVGAYTAVWVGIGPRSGNSNDLNFNIYQLETRLWMSTRQQLEMRALHKLRLQIAMSSLKEWIRRKFTHCPREEQERLPLCLGSGYERK